MKGNAMKPLLLTLIFSFFILGCDEVIKIDTTPPPPPQGIVSISLDEAVELQWLPSQADDVQGYNVWVSDSYDGSYSLIASVSTTNFIDAGINNGETYYYAVSAYDYDDNESSLSKDVVYDTPRPEGYNVILSDYRTFPNSAGYDFSQFTTLSYDDVNADFFFENASGKFNFIIWDDNDNCGIQDMGYTSTLDDISYSPIHGWAPSNTVEAILGHTYIVRTWNDHYAKVRVTDVNTSRVVFDWAYQTAAGNTELSLHKKNIQERKPHNRSQISQ
jgi:hypothetical protein